MHFLEKIEGPGWKWSKECDRKLICKLVADAKITEWFNQNITTSTKEENGSELVKKIGVVVAFLATHSGLTRWQNFPQNFDESSKPNFEHISNRAIDEVWYQRAVEQHFVDPSSFVYSVPHNVGNNTETLVTVSNAIFKEEGSKKAPVAVVGYQFYHMALQTLFTKITTSCGDIACKRTCESEELHCLILDDNGYIIVSDNPQETGFFFGKIRSDIMQQLVEEGIYKVTTMYDYQGLCTIYLDTFNPASRLFSPPVYFGKLLKWITVTILHFAKTVFGDFLESVLDSDYNNYKEKSDVTDSDIRKISEISDTELIMKFALNKTKPEPCDNQFSLYTLIHYNERNISNSGYNKSMDDCKRSYIVQKVLDSNMILLVVNKLCRESEDTIAQSPDPEEVDYNMSLTCYREIYNAFPRRHYMSCINRDANESKIKLCGTASYISPKYIVEISFCIVNLYLFLL